MNTSLQKKLHTEDPIRVILSWKQKRAELYYKGNVCIYHSKSSWNASTIHGCVQLQKSSKRGCQQYHIFLGNWMAWKWLDVRHYISLLHDDHVLPTVAEERNSVSQSSFMTSYIQHFACYSSVPKTVVELTAHLPNWAHRCGRGMESSKIWQDKKTQLTFKSINLVTTSMLHIPPQPQK